MDDFEALLQKKRDLVDVYEQIKKNPKRNAIQRADKGANIFDLISMINRLISLTIKKSLNVEFWPDEKRERLLAQSEKIDCNIITYKMISRVNKDEKKSRIRQEVEEVSGDDGEKRLGFISGHSFESIVQFNIFSNSYEAAEKIMEEFETLMEVYGGFFKRNGIKEICFEKQLTDSHYDIYRENLSVRNIQYYVETERVSVIFNEKVKEIEILMSEKEDK